MRPRGLRGAGWFDVMQVTQGDRHSVARRAPQGGRVAVPLRVIERDVAELDSDVKALHSALLRGVVHGRTPLRRAARNERWADSSGIRASHMPPVIRL